MRWRSAVPWILGFVVVANVYVLPGLDNSPRALDLLSIIALAWLVWRLAGRGLPPVSLGMLAVLNLMPAIWFGVAAATGKTATLLLTARWLLGVPMACALLVAAREPAGRVRLAWGLWWGLALNVAVLALQWFGRFDWTRAAGLAASDSVLSDLDEVLRYPGMHGHANASSAVASLIAPVGLYLYFQGRARLWVPIVSLLLLLASGHITSSRSPLIIGGIVSLLMIGLARQPRRTLRLAVGLGAVVLPVFAWLGPPGGQVRWEDQGNITVNRTERLASNREALRLIGDHPLGSGVEGVGNDLSDLLDNPSTHNALLELAADFGLPMSLVIALLLLALAGRLARGTTAPLALESALALQILGLFFFEEHGNNPTFIALTSWLVATAPLRPAPGLVGRAGEIRGPLEAPGDAAPTAPAGGFAP